jgi:hypothetical protein
MELTLVPDEFFLAKKIKKQNNYVYMAKVQFTGNQVLIETRYFRDYPKCLKFANSRKFVDPAIRITVNIFAVPFEQPDNCMDLLTVVNN